MKNLPQITLPILALALASTAGATTPADATDKLRAAAQQLEDAALLRNVATDRAEVQHLLAARDLLREAQPSLDGPLRAQAQVLEYEISRDAGAAGDKSSPAALLSPAPPAALAPLDRSDLDELALRSQALVRQAGADR
jgi:hypothetical protein